MPQKVILDVDTGTDDAVASAEPRRCTTLCTAFLVDPRDHDEPLARTR